MLVRIKPTQFFLYAKTVWQDMNKFLHFSKISSSIIIISLVAYSPLSIHGISLSEESVVPSPLKQFKAGIVVQNVICKAGLQLIIKAEDGSPACASPNTAGILIERGWAKSIIGQITQINNTSNAKNNDPFGITALVIYHPSFSCLGPTGNATTNSCPPNNFYLEINSNSTAYLLGYNICDASSCAKNNTLSVLLPINTILKPNYQMIGLPVDLQWKNGDTVSIQLRVSSTPDNQTGLMMDKGNSTIVP